MQHNQRQQKIATNATEKKAIATHASLQIEY